jgi:histidyl-tRNA synthetase
MKAQMKAADRSGAATAIIVGGAELEAGTVLVKPLRGDGEQVAVPRAELVDRLRGSLGGRS